MAATFFRRWVSAAALTSSLLLAALPAGAQQDVRFTVQLEPPVMGLEETAELSVELAWSGFGNPRVQPSFDLDNLEIVEGPIRSSATRFLEGAASRTLTLSWTLRPLRLGEGRVSDLRLRLGGTTYELPSQTLEVVSVAPVRPPPRRTIQDVARERGLIESPGGAAEREQEPEEADPSRRIFLRAEVTPARPYVGQQMLYTLYLYHQVSARSIRPRALPEFRDFWVREIAAAQHGPSSVVRLDGRSYNRAVLLQRVLFPLKAGRLPLEAAEAEMVVVGLGGQQPQGSRGEVIHRRSNALEVEVRPLPPAPEGVSGAVGQLSVAMEVQPARLQVGEAATLTLRLVGTGQLSALPAPEIALPREIDALPPKPEVTDELEGGVVHQTVLWRYALVPRQTGSWQLPAVRVPHFLPREGEYRLAETGPLTLEVLPAAAAPGEPAVEGEGAAARGEPERRRLWPWLAGLLLAALLLAGWRLWRRRPRRRPGTAPSAAAVALAGRLEKLAHGEQGPRRLASELEAAWRQYLEQRWQLPASAPLAQWPARLGERGVRRREVEGVELLVEQVLYLRQAPQLADLAVLRGEVSELSRQLLRGLD